ncbi:histidine phosphatase family protein [Pseudomonas sp. PDNC002]|uniref:lipopolysaccharide core heptose(II)-phosphate phosphatase PmrG n=1 Tax=Pseudomonas sp. PDNC002 TaxID=2811422 RepID=UPI0019655A9D|nr:histidine phosphatase family protein [Pseudomonas sp. PDNC002]QRY78366.1 histidine phosphatase family protein [Pseudomonas sp. PDNC002]
MPIHTVLAALSRRWLYLVALLPVIGLLSGFLPLNTAQAPALVGDAERQAELREHWRKGDLIVLVRHAERCDRSSSPCLAESEGITVRGGQSARQLGQDFAAMGLANADVLSSNQLRAAQTATSMFDKAPVQQPWLYNCQGSMLREALEHKVAHRNLILVTHSECIEDLEHSISVPDPETPDYGSSLFLLSDGQQAPTLLGYLRADQWPQSVSER